MLVPTDRQRLSCASVTLSRLDGEDAQICASRARHAHCRATRMRSPRNSDAAALMFAVCFACASLLGGAAWAMPNRNSGCSRSHARSEAMGLRSAVVLYVAESGACPASLTDLHRAGVVPKTRTFTDPWGSPLRLACGLNPGFQVFSLGPDRLPGTADDIVESSGPERSLLRLDSDAAAESGIDSDSDSGSDSDSP